ncbi:MAG: DUF4398 domain-containing protein [Exilispira sp.]
MKKKLFFIIIIISLVLLLSASGCQTTSPSQTSQTEETSQQSQQTSETTEKTEQNQQNEQNAEEPEKTQQSEETQQTEEKKDENISTPVFDEEEASKLNDEIKLEIAKAQQIGAEDYAPELFREAMDLFEQAQQLYDQKQDFTTFKQLIEQARTKAELAYEQSAEKKYQENKDEILKLKSQTSSLTNQEYYKDDFVSAQILLNQAEELINNKDYINAIGKLEEAKSIYNKIFNDYNMDKNYVYSEFPKLLSLQNELISKNIKNIYNEDYNKFNEMFIDLKTKIDENNFKAAKELLQMSYILGRNLIERYMQAVSIINQTEASRYLFHCKQAYEFAKERESKYNVDQLKVLIEMEKLIQEAEENFNKMKYFETISICKDIMILYSKLILEQSVQNKTYTVRLIPERRDCLWRIAGYSFIYNNPYLWPLIWVANLDIITNPDLIFPGQILIIPPLPQ